MITILELAFHSQPVVEGPGHSSSREPLLFNKYDIVREIFEMKIFQPLVVGALITFSGCSPADVGSQVAAFNTALDDTTKVVGPGLKKGVARERAQAIAEAARKNEPIYKSPVACREVAFGLENDDGLATQPSACVLKPEIKIPAQRGSATYANNGMQALRAYGRVLAGLSGSKVAEDVSKNFKAFSGSLNAFAKEQRPERGDVIDTSKIEGLSGLFGTLVEARRRSILKKLVDTAHPEIEILTAELIAHFASEDRLLQEAKSLQSSWERMAFAQGTSGYLAAVRAYETEFDRYKKRLAKSKAGQILRIWRSHQILHAKLQSKADLELIERFVKDTQELGG